MDGLAGDLRVPIAAAGCLEEAVLKLAERRRVSLCCLKIEREGDEERERERDGDGGEMEERWREGDVGTEWDRDVDTHGWLKRIGSIFCR